MSIKRFIYIILFFALFISGTAYVMGIKSKQPELSSTNITAHLNQKIDKEKNLVYCSTFQLAWNELKDTIIKEDIKLLNETSMVNFLNKGEFTHSDLSDNSYVAMAGYGKDDIINKINTALQRKFKSDAPIVKDQVGYYGIIAYAFLYKNLHFNPVFESLDTPIKFNSGSYVKAFGIKSYETKHEKLLKQLSIPYYKNNDEFIVKLTPDKSNDEIFLAKIQPVASLKDTLKYAQNKIAASKPDYLYDGDTLKIPKFKFKLEHSFGELQNKPFLNKNLKGTSISEAIQNIEFKLDEKGAILKSEAKIIIEVMHAKLQTKYLVFDKPFLLFMKEKQSNNPYLVIWVNNTDLLVKN